MWIFVNALIENPTFDSQTKENMTLQVKNFGSTCQLSEKFIKAVSILREIKIEALYFIFHCPSQFCRSMFFHSEKEVEKKKQLLCHWSFQSLNYHAYIPPLLITIQFRSLLDSAHITAKHWSPKVVLNHISKTQFCPHWLPYKEFPYPQKTKLFSFLVKGPNQPLGYIKKKLSTFSISPLL